MTKPLSPLWRDVTCPACRARLAEADHPGDAYAVFGFVGVWEGHAHFWQSPDDGIELCEAVARPPGTLQRKGA